MVYTYTQSRKILTLLEFYCKNAAPSEKSLHTHHIIQKFFGIGVASNFVRELLESFKTNIF